MDVKGKLPLHLACELGKEWCDAGVERIHEAFPAAIRQAEGNARGWQALHMASSCPTASVELIDKLVDLNTEDNDVDEFDKDAKKTDEAADAAKLDILFNILRADPTTILPMPF